MKHILTTLTILLLATLWAGAQNEIRFGYDAARELFVKLNFKSKFLL
jgi:ABC-type sulfate transport system substrate-binding protein